MLDFIFGGNAVQIVLTGFFVGAVVGVTGMGGGALMTPALIFLGVGNASAIVTADLTAAAVYKSGGAAVHWREGSPNLRLAGWLIAGSVPFALLGPFLVHWVAGGDEAQLQDTLKLSIGWALLLAASTYAVRLWLNLLQLRRSGVTPDPDPRIRALPTFLVGAVGGLLVGVTSVGSGSVIMVALLALYPGLSAVKMVGTDLLQAVPLVLAAAISNISVNGLDLSLTIPLIIGSVPGTILGARIAPRLPVSFVRRGIVIVLTMSGVALLDKAGWGPLGAGEDQTHPYLIAGIGVAMLFLVPVLWGFVRRSTGLPMFGSPSVAEIESGGPSGRTGPSGSEPDHSPTASRD